MGTKNSDLVANFEATPPVLTDSALLHGVLRVAQGTIVVAAGDSDDDDIVMLAPIPSNATVSNIWIGADNLGGSCTYNVGIYQSDGTVVDEDYYATAVADGVTVLSDVRFEAANINTAGKAMWEMAGASSDPGGFYYIAATMAAAGGTEGDMSFCINYVVN